MPSIQKRRKWILRLAIELAMLLLMLLMSSNLVVADHDVESDNIDNPPLSSTFNSTTQNSTLSTSTISTSPNDNITKLDCSMRQLAVEYARHILTEEIDHGKDNRYHDDDDWILWVQQQVHDALRIEQLCGTQLKNSSSSSSSNSSTSKAHPPEYDDDSSSNDNDTDGHSDSYSSSSSDDNATSDYWNLSTYRGGGSSSRRSDQLKRDQLEETCRNSEATLCVYVLPSEEKGGTTTENTDDDEPQHRSIPSFRSIHQAISYSQDIISTRERQYNQYQFHQELQQRRRRYQDMEIRRLKSGGHGHAKDEDTSIDRDSNENLLSDQSQQELLLENGVHQPSPEPQLPVTSLYIILRHGIHTLDGQPIHLDGDDFSSSSITTTHLIGYPGEEIWISGGIGLPPTSQLQWKPWIHNPNVLVTTLPQLLFTRKDTHHGKDRHQQQQRRRQRNGSTTETRQYDVENRHDEVLEVIEIPKIVSLFTSTKRYVRARYPNSNPEIDQWGYASFNRYNYSISPKYNVIEWHKPPKSTNPAPPRFEFYDFSKPNFDSNNVSLPIKNNSAQVGYNWYASGRGGVCSTVWGPDANSYWCSNASQGGWSEVDQECAISGRLQLPIGMTYNLSTHIGQRFHTWYNGIDGSRKYDTNATHEAEIHKGRTSAAVGGIIHAWHSQSWSMHMFEIEQHNVDSSSPSPLDSSSSGLDDDSNEWFQFRKGGGRQGGRNWCRCDQCTYAGGWCGQHDNPPNNNDTRLISGTFYVEQILAELDTPGEYYFDHSSRTLYVYPNDTSTSTTATTSTPESNDLNDLRMPLLDRLITIDSNASNIVIENVGFRDMAPTYMHDQWSAPSGGDWSLHRGGAILVENASNITIRNCHFYRLDGNAVFLSRRTRDVVIEDNLFEWLGENAVATWGDTGDPDTGLRGYDGTAENFPINTTIQYNVFRELGIYQKQSSAVGQAKAAMTTIRHNIMFNMPRAAINFNDMLGGGDVVEKNLIFNTCRESGDHGPINTWDRQAFLTTLRDGVTPSFDPMVRVIRNNFIFANYGASQGVDNDDGSSWHHISHNVFYWADGFKMDYGGHDSVFEDNLVLSIPYDGANCFNMAGFLPGHGDKLRRNICVVGLGNRQTGSGCGDPSCASPNPIDDDEKLEVVGWSSGCNESIVTMEHNQYFTPKGQAKANCGSTVYSLEELQEKFGLDLGSTWSSIPDDEQIMVDWAKSILFPSPGEAREVSLEEDGMLVTIE